METRVCEIDQAIPKLHQGSYFPSLLEPRRPTEKALDQAGITVNKKLIPYDLGSAKVTSGILVGTPALTSHGFGVNEMEPFGKLVGEVLCTPCDERRLVAVQCEVRSLTEAFHVPGIAPDYE